MVKGGTSIKQFANAGRSKKKSPIRRFCVSDTCMEVGVTTANVSITDTSNVIDTTVKDGEMPFFFIYFLFFYLCIFIQDDDNPRRVN